MVRTTRKKVIFKSPFKLGDFGEVLPPGVYDVETDEEVLESLSFQGYRRLVTLIYLPVKAGRSGLLRTLTINPAELEAALERDRAADIAASAQVLTRVPLGAPLKTQVFAADCRALERAENEGMIAHPPSVLSASPLEVESHKGSTTSASKEQ